MKENSIGDRLDKIEETLLILTSKLTEINVRAKAYDAKLNAYQKASTRVVNLAFALIATAVLTIIIPAIAGG